MLTIILFKNHVKATAGNDQVGHKFDPGTTVYQHDRAILLD